MRSFLIPRVIQEEVSYVYNMHNIVDNIELAFPLTLWNNNDDSQAFHKIKCH
jgi:hypothetical protein